MQLSQRELVGVLERLLDPVARRVHLQAEARFRRDEGPLARMILNLEIELGRPLDRLVVSVLIECDAEMVDPRPLPVARLDNDVDGSLGELDEAKPEPLLLELLPRDAGLEPERSLAHPAVTADQLEAEPADVPRLHEPHLARDEVVVEELHRPGTVSPLWAWRTRPGCGESGPHVDTAALAAASAARL